MLLNLPCRFRPPCSFSQCGISPPAPPGEGWCSMGTGRLLPCRWHWLWPFSQWLWEHLTWPCSKHRDLVSAHSVQVIIQGEQDLEGNEHTAPG